MKNYLLFPILILVVLFQSCEKSELKETNIDLVKIENVKSLSGDEQKVAFRLLSNENRAKLWVNRMDEILENERLNNIQEKLIVELKKYITADFYDKDKVYPHEDKMEYLKLKIKQEFGRNKTSAFFTEINSELIAARGNDCGCSIEDDWCAWWNDCNGASNCIMSEGLGCGWLWESWCNGTCE